ncbi:MAG: endonuclease Q family protein [Nanoarchaeota archaeon]|nr:endonuclease Q family protein [Nanoarchaeota archaeon]MBU1104050.1 endonuclease Q family protein [Nanoarchaeota archaeon]
MKLIADLHIHSKHARACSSALSIPNLEKYAKIKGINLLGTGDFQHPLHREHINEHLKEDSNGILRTSSGFPFIWQTEISFMYSQNNKRRAVHLVVLSPNTETSNKITSYLLSKGRVDYDGRPIFGIPCDEFVKDLKQISEEIEIIPAHCMTPWFGLFGSKSGFDSLEECFQEQTKHIYAVESGMSADPPMLWRFKQKFNVVSFSDAHSFWPWRIGREATIFDIPEVAHASEASPNQQDATTNTGVQFVRPGDSPKWLTYKNIINAIRTGKNLTTIETPPAYGRYHWDGHRDCNFSCDHITTKHNKGVCPKCKKPLTIGVDYRVEEIAKELKGFTPADAKNFYELLPLHELIALHLSSSLNTKKTWALYNELIEKFNNEFNILLNLTKEDLQKASINEKLAEIILLNRENKLSVKPGYDGEYGVLQLPSKQATLF